MSLADELHARIARDGPMRARDFLAAALAAYYGRGPAIGAEGDFYTASNVSLFPHALARFVKAASERLEGARVVEIGGGRGDLASALGSEVTLVEPAAGLARVQADRGLRVVEALDALRPAPTLYLANEVLDALPVHRIHQTREGAREGWIHNGPGGFVERPGPLSPELAAFSEGLADGDVREVCLDARGLLADMARAAPTAIALFIDYATTGSRPGGSLRGFHRHRVTPPFERPGEQDVTADVDFAQIARFAEETGWNVLGERAQGEFLADLGLVDDLMLALQQGNVEAYAAGKNLLLPGGMGERFRVLCLARGVAREPPLPGFRADTFPGASRR